MQASQSKKVAPDTTLRVKQLEPSKIKPKAENERDHSPDHSQRISVHPITMQEVCMLPKATWPECVTPEPEPKEEEPQDMSPTSKYQQRKGSVPGTAHLANMDSERMRSGFF
eukprot:gnl/MRDRNA2_/MRDRNA2_34653_c0_seq1.p1 gnl/MRDRNA2_/MRDRNA2_34653_c0~~gnl/MRDRNA2_/MRDRNA2_34653_c0_seq1.p1  ORF type:complete len:112 (+),score=26.52 gnl/MRDRNA2_/MRDRNA2_34653_c0_seq1:65-400(+)